MAENLTLQDTTLHLPNTQLIIAQSISDTAESRAFQAVSSAIDLSIAYGVNVEVSETAPADDIKALRGQEMSYKLGVAKRQLIETDVDQWMIRPQTDLSETRRI